MAELHAERPTAEDLEAILALMNDPRSVHRQVPCRHGERPESYAQLYERLSEDDNLVLLSADTPVGYASWQTFGQHAHLNVMVIAGSHQRRGLGKALFQAFLQAVKDAGGASVSLRAYQDSSWAIDFYTGLGMRRYQPGDERTLGAGGLDRYIRSAIENGQWPAADKVMFVGELE